MNKEELRIGNIFELDEIQQGDLISKYVRITSLSEKAAHWVSISTNGIIGRCHSGTSYKDIVPIPLTEELLFKIGFKIIENEYSLGYGNNDDHVFYIDKGGFILVCINGIFKKHYDIEQDNWYSFQGIEIKYFHQLQNITYALTGEELTVSL